MIFKRYIHLLALTWDQKNKRSSFFKMFSMCLSFILYFYFIVFLFFFTF